MHDVDRFSISAGLYFSKLIGFKKTYFYVYQIFIIGYIDVVVVQPGIRTGKSGT